MHDTPPLRSSVILLAPYLSPENAEELLAAATHKTKFEVEQLVAGRFPRLDVPVLVEAIEERPSRTPWLTDEPGPTRDFSLSPGTVNNQSLAAPSQSEVLEAAQPPLSQLAPGQVRASCRSKVTPLAPERFALQVTIDQETLDYLNYAQALLSQQVPTGDVPEVFRRALKALVAQLERQKFGTTSRPRHGQRRPKPGSRYIPAAVKHAVWKRDGARCTFVSDTGHRCPARTLLEFDHVLEVARGGEATVAGIRLRCRAHNQFTAERTFGAAFMRHKRQAAAQRAAEASARLEVQEHTRNVMAGLRELGVRADKARLAAERAATLPNATLEERMRAALKFICPQRPRCSMPMTGVPRLSPTIPTRTS